MLWVFKTRFIGNFADRFVQFKQLLLCNLERLDRFKASPDPIASIGIYREKEIEAESKVKSWLENLNILETKE